MHPILKLWNSIITSLTSLECSLAFIFTPSLQTDSLFNDSSAEAVFVHKMGAILILAFEFLWNTFLPIINFNWIFTVKICIIYSCNKPFKQPQSESLSQDLHYVLEFMVNKPYFMKRPHSYHFMYNQHSLCLVSGYCRLDWIRTLLSDY